MQTNRIRRLFWVALLMMTFPGLHAWASEPVLIARFESSVIELAHRPQQKTSAWDLWRDAGRVEIRDGEGATGELWLRNRDGLISYHRLFHGERRSIDYATGDLRSLQSMPDWRLLGEIVDIERLRGALKRTDDVEILERTAQRYQGQLDGVDIELLWLEAERLPARVRQTWPDRVLTLELKALSSGDQAPWAPTRVRDYQGTDYADIGDQHTDPFLQAVLQAKHGHHGHRH